jgi:hypothetical protein
MARAARGSAVEAYFIKLAAMLGRQGHSADSPRSDQNGPGCRRNGESLGDFDLGKINRPWRGLRKFSSMPGAVYIYGLRRGRPSS